MGDIGTRVVQVPFSRGVNTRADKRAVEAPSLTWAQNVVLDTEGVIRKRKGYVSLATTNPRGGLTFDRCDGLATYEGGLVAFCKSHTYARTAAGDDLVWIERGRSPVALEVGRGSVGRSADTAGISRADVAYESASGILVGIYILTAPAPTSPRLVGSVTDLRTGTRRWHDSIATNVQRFRALTVGQYIFIVMPSDNSANININRLDCNAPNNLNTNPNGGPQATDYDFATGAIGVSPFSATQWFLAYSRGTSIFVSKRSLTGVSVASAVIAETVAGPVACRYIGSLLWVAWQRAGGDVRAAAYDSSMSLVVAPFTVSAASAQTFTLQLGARTATSVLLGWDNGTDCRFRAITTAGALSGAEMFYVAHHIESGFFEVDGSSFIAVGSPSAIQGGTFLIDVTFQATSSISSLSLAPLVSGALPTTTPGDTVSGVVTTAEGTFIFAQTIKTKVNLSGGGTFAYANANLGVDYVEVDMTSTKRFRTTEHGRLLAIAGGTPCVFDGEAVFELGFLKFPETPTTGAPLATLGFIAPGIYQYVATYRYDDARGRVWRSNPSLPITVTVPAGTNTNRVSLTVPMLQFTRVSGGGGAGNVRIEFWRTAAGSSGPFYLVGGTSNNPQAAPTASLIDTLADASVTVNETLYTSGGALGNFPAPPCSFVVSHNDVLIVNNSEDGSLWQSKPLVVGEGFAFSAALTYRLSSREMPVMGASMDDKCIIFTEHEIHMLVGTPLDDNGSGGGFTAQRLSSPVGCVDPRSVVVAKDGVYFLSQRGIELLTRGLEVILVGGDVDYWTDNYAECFFAGASAETSEIRFGMSSPVGGVSETHQILRLNYERKSQEAPFGAWTTELLGMGAPRAGAQSADLMHFGYSDGRLFAESRTVFTDNGAFVPMAVRMMLKPAGLQGFVRLRRLSVLAERKSAHELTFYIRYNYDDAIVSQRAWSNAEIAALPREQLTMLVDRQKAQSYEVELRDAEDTSGPGPDTGEGCWLSGLAMELGVKERAFARAMAMEAKK
jgi:hypothetical protein